MFYDVVIVGAGPSGSTAAIAIKQKFPNLDVLVIDKSDFPRDKICGDGIGPGSLLIAEQLGIFDKIFAGDDLISDCILYGSKNGPLRTAIPKVGSRPTSGAIVRRTEFDDRLYRAAQDLGVESLTARFLSTDVDGDLRIVSVDESTIRTRLLIGADGASSRVRKALGEKSNSDRKRAIAIRSYVDVISAPADQQNVLLFEFNEQLCPGYGWVFPLKGDSANIGVGVSVTEFKKRNLDLKELLNQYLDTLRERGWVMGDATEVASYMLPNGSHRPKLAHDRAVLIGDAASMINPLTGEGIFYGMAAASMLSECLSAELAQKELRYFSRLFNKRFRWHYWNNYLALRALSKWKTTEWAFEALERDPEALNVAVDMMFGDGHLKPRTVFRLARRSLF